MSSFRYFDGFLYFFIQNSDAFYIYSIYNIAKVHLSVRYILTVCYEEIERKTQTKTEIFTTNGEGLRIGLYHHKEIADVQPVTTEKNLLKNRLKMCKFCLSQFYISKCQSFSNKFKS